MELRVFYLWDFGVKETVDPTFQHSFTWDIPLLDGYKCEFLPNRSKDPGTHHFRGLDNPGAVSAIAGWKPDVILLFGYNYLTHLNLILSPRLRRIPMWIRGDSHDLSRNRNWKSTVGRMLRKVLFRRFECALAVGKANAEYFRNNGLKDDMIVTAPHCVDNERFQSARPQSEKAAAAWKHELGIPEGATVILFAGKIEEKKRPRDLL